MTGAGLLWPRAIARASTATLVGPTAGAYVILFYRLHSTLAVSDFDAIWTAAQALRAHIDPLRGDPGAPWLWNLQYPLPAALAAIPVSFLPLWLARAAFMGLSSGVLARALTRRAWWPVIALAGGPFPLWPT